MKIFKILLLIVPLFIISNISMVQEVQSDRCAPREIVVSALKEKAFEELKYIGLIDSKHMIEIYVNKQTQKWTLLGSSLSSSGDKLSCILYFGDAWTLIEKQLTEENPEFSPPF